MNERITLIGNSIENPANALLPKPPVKSSAWRNWQITEFTAEAYSASQNEHLRMEDLGTVKQFKIAHGPFSSVGIFSTG